MSKARESRPALVPTFPRISYGPDSLNYMTVWLAEASQPSPAAILRWWVGDGRRLSPQDKSADATSDEAGVPVLRA